MPGVPVGVIGMIHLPPLPGAPGWAGEMESILERARVDARALDEGGVDAILVENYGDAPFHKTVGPETVAVMTAALAAVRQVTGRPLGVNVLRNDPRGALSVAAATGAAFIRVNVHTGGMYTDQGWIEGRAADTVRLRDRLGDIAILADVMVKHATPPQGMSLESAARDTAHRGRADALIVSGTGTGTPTALEDLETVRAAVPDTPLLVGSGVTAETVAAALEVADGVIVGSALMRDGSAGGPVDADRVARFMERARA